MRRGSASHSTPGPRRSVDGDGSSKMKATAQRMKTFKVETPIALLVLMALTLLCAPAMAQAPNASPQTCEKLVDRDFTQVMDASTHVTAAVLIAGERPACHLTGYVEPHAGFEMLLPVTGWNGKFLHI